jgi:DNA polymerase-3 subunit gamma/tau
LEITNGNSTDVFEIDGASNNGIDQVRDLRDNAKYLPSHSRYKIFIIDEVHMLSTAAFNALLKTLEEPPEHVKFIFATTEPHKLPITILSRCQRLDFKRVSVPRIIARLRYIADAEKIEISDASLALVARKGDGSMRDSITTFDQVLAFCGEEVVDEDVASIIGAVDRRLLNEACFAVFASDTQRTLEIVKRVDDVGYNMRQFCQELIEYFRNLLVVRSVPRPEEILDIAEDELRLLRLQAEQLSALDIQRRLTLLIKAENEMAYSSYPRLTLEMALLKCATLEAVIPVHELLEKIRLMETNAVHTPALPWEAVQAQKPQDQRQTENHKTAAHPQTTPYVSASGTKAASPALPQQPAVGKKDWEHFVSFAVVNNPAIGSVLEHGSPIKMESGSIEIGFPAESYFLTSARDPDSLAAIKALAEKFNGRETKVTITAISQDSTGSPESLAEKKKRDEDERAISLKKEIESHPLINEALRVFGGAITDIKAL